MEKRKQREGEAGRKKGEGEKKIREEEERRGEERGGRKEGKGRKSKNTWKPSSIKDRIREKYFLRLYTNYSENKQDNQMRFVTLKLSWSAETFPKDIIKRTQFYFHP